MTTKEFFGRSWQSDEELLDEFIAKSTLSAKLLIIRPGNTKVLETANASLIF